MTIASAPSASGGYPPNILSLHLSRALSHSVLERIAAWWQSLWDKAAELRQRMFDNDDWPDDWGLGV